MPSQVGFKRAGWVSHPILTAPYEVGWQLEAWQEVGAHVRRDPKSVTGGVQRTNGHVAPGAATATGDVNALRFLLPGHLLSGGAIRGQGPRAGGEGVVEELLLLSQPHHPCFSEP